jgi:hypothetical protein
MKIEVKPFDDQVRFVPSIAFIRLKNRTRGPELITSCRSHYPSFEKLRAVIAREDF